MTNSPSTPTPQEKLTSLLNSMRFSLNNLQSEVLLASLRDGLEDLDTQINGLPGRIKDLRTRGYVFGKDQDAKAQELRRRWSPVRVNVQSEINRQVPRLQAELSPLEAQFVQVKGRAAFPATALPAAERLDAAVGTLKSKVRSTESTIRGMYDSFSNEVNAFKSELDRVTWMLKELSEGCFQLLATEGCVMAVKATYSRDEKMDKDDPQGILFLTDQRLIFEQKQDIATKKVLFITTEKKKVQQVLFDVPVVLIEKVDASKKGMFGNEDHLALIFKSGAPARQAWFHLSGQDCKWWSGLIGRVRTGDFHSERAVEVDKAVEEKVRSAPSQCPNCGAPVSQTVLRGMASITCEYCQFVMRL
jgi:hypothetical protein